MCDGHTASVMRRPERDYLREKGRRTRRQRRAIGKLPDAGKLHRSGIRQDMTAALGSRKFIKQGVEEKREKKSRGRQRCLRFFDLV